ncbi:ribbon-helix-helix domain-containing protein [Ensifer sp. LCM 4579]|uniref:ribbon-helix-helix domain-containing protein n=1 Tax=Ensifer sp. LCM 4579 TaxID=1848292 RepID=UPI0008D8FE6E|nr:ribbon-helix-helix domain-containing protein [Ensifer sp. LCM 4579]OHV79597.1 CopG family transcriptional regulator [Ensifer sp. LCM 4579]
MAEKLSITLPTEMADAIKARVEAGLYGSTSEAMRAAVRALLRDEEEHEERLAAIRARVRQSVEDPRPSLTGREVRAHLNSIYSKHQS